MTKAAIASLLTAARDDLGNAMRLALRCGPEAQSEMARQEDHYRRRITLFEDALADLELMEAQPGLVVLRFEGKRWRLARWLDPDLFVMVDDDGAERMMRRETINRTAMAPLARPHPDTIRPTPRDKVQLHQQAGRLLALLDRTPIARSAMTLGELRLSNTLIRLRAATWREDTLIRLRDDTLERP